MPFRITLALDLFTKEAQREESQAALNIMLRNLLEIDELHLRYHPETPWLYESGVRYMEECPGQEDWCDIPTILKLRFADCEDLVCWRAAELRVRRGIDAKPVFRGFPRPNGSMLYHVLVQYPDGSIEDPSKLLGMR